MTQTKNPPEENKKREAFKRFSKMSAAGLAVLSISAFTDVSVKQLPTNMENIVEENQNFLPSNSRMNKSFTFDNVRFTYADSDTTTYGDDNDHNLHGEHAHPDISYPNVGYTNHVDYSNNYSNNCE
jgi:hypothetical protein